ncbi:DUF1697 domain-containing protein [Sphingomonas sp. Root241]|uniref:DUF1697 domain-containing protein n=1 Tax=Sphingomonas sp. Root241 TaxID=1736501 RepID=UPI0006FB4779|nr:DUF1697 domain-containing protein [Sphingomonas sp. Root241]KRC78864.1 hypothetical protein ASE13_15525 [Sphingomonas sp. Root241]
MNCFVALIRAIGPSTHAKMSMRDLTEACRRAGLVEARSWITTGNLVLATTGTAEDAEAMVGEALRSFGLGNEVVIRTSDELAAIVAANPFPEAVLDRAHEMAVCFVKSAGRGFDGLDRHSGRERLARVGIDLVVDYAGQMSRSKLLPSAIERRTGARLTFRNWNTLIRLARMAAEVRA